MPGLAGQPGTGLAGAGQCQDEIQVYDNSIDKQGEWGLELNVNSKPSGRSVPDYPGEVPPAHALPSTPELSYGLGHGVETGLYLPSIVNAEGQVTWQA